MTTTTHTCNTPVSFALDPRSAEKLSALCGFYGETEDRMVNRAIMRMWQSHLAKQAKQAKQGGKDAK